MYIPVAQRKSISTVAPTTTGRYIPVAQRSKTPIVTTPVATTRPDMAKIAAEQKIYDANVKKTDGIWDIFREAFQPDTFGKAILSTGKDILQGTARNFASTGLTITGQKEIKESPTSKFLYGAGDVKNIPTRITEAKKVVEESPFAKSIGADKLSGPLAGLGVVGGTLLDLSLFGGGKGVKTLSKDVPEIFLKKLAKESDETAINTILKRIGLDEINSNKLARELAPTKNVDEVKNVLVNYETGQAKNALILAEKQAAAKHLPPLPKINNSVTKDQLQAQIDLTKELIANHPGTKLTKLIPASKLKTNYLDRFVGENLSKNILKSNAKKDELNLKLQSVFEGTPKSDQFDNYDVIEETIDEVKGLKERLKALYEQRKTLPKIQLSEEGIPMARKSVPFMPRATSSETKPIPRAIDTTTGEGRSLEQIVLQGEEYTPPTKLPSDSLPDLSSPPIVPAVKTPVNKRVNPVDTYLRTPSFVMDKIGLGKEAKMLRSAADKTKVELKKNIDKIKDWEKEVPGKEANENIFDFLNGKAIDLPPNQKKVALEIRNWLKTWAKRFGLPEDKQIDYYITHIWDKDLADGEFPEELAKLIADQVPGSVYDPFLLQRLNKEGYKRDTWAALDAYVKRGTRKVHMDPVLDVVREKTGSSLKTTKLEESVFKYVQKYVDNINMRPTDFDKGMDNLFRSLLDTKIGRKITRNKLGTRPYSTITKGFRRATFRGMLGGNLTSALRNLSQGTNVFAVLGTKYTLKGYINLYKITPGTKQQGTVNELAEEGIFDGGFIQDRIMSSFKRKIETFDKGLFFLFDTAEHINRGAAYFGAKAKALDMGMAEREARDYAKNVVKQTQFLYDTVDTPVGLASDTAKTLTQFGTYSIKQAEFLANLLKDKNYMALMRYALAGLVFTYTIGKAFDMKPDELIPFYGSIKRGQLPFGNAPSLKFPTELGKAALNVPDKYGNPRDFDKKLEDIGSSTIGLIPGGIQLKKIFAPYKPKEKKKKSGLPSLPKLPKLPKIKIN